MFPRQIDEFLFFTNELDVLNVGHVDCYSGSGFKVPIFGEHMRTDIERPDFIMGGSGGSITTVCRAMGEYGVGIFDSMSGLLDDSKPMDGIDGWFTDARWHCFGWMVAPWLMKLCGFRNPNGILFHDPLKKKIDDYIDPKRFRCPVGIAVDIRGVGYRVLVFGSDSDPKLVRDAVLASCMIAVAMDTPVMNIPGIGDVVASDGGHAHYLPLPRGKTFQNLDSLDACIATPSESIAKSSRSKNALLSSILWAVEEAYRTPLRRDLADLRELRRAGVLVTAYAPLEDPGGTLDAGRGIMISRRRMGVDMLEQPFIS